MEKDTYAVAAAGVELGLLYLDTGDLEESQKALELAKYSFLHSYVC